MTEPSGGAAGSDESARLFADWVARRASGEEVDLEALRGESPQHAERLASFAAAWTELEGVLRELGLAGSGSPSGDSDSGDDDVVRAVFERLAKRGAGFRRYLARGEVAAGGMGSIRRVWDSDLRRELAMKVVLEPDADSGAKLDPRVLLRFIEEAQVTGQLDHPGVVPVHELGLDAEGRVYFTMRLVAGRDLEAIFELVETEAEGWSVTRAVGVLLKVCEAMAYAHSKGVVHRDLKPANVMVGRFGEVYVMDWGLAHVLGAEEPSVAPRTTARRVLTDLQEAKASSLTAQVTLAGDVVGTPAYMSPEQAGGDLDRLGPLSDVYSAGAILYHLLSGRTPYVGAGETPSAFDVWKRVRAGAPPSLDSLGRDVQPELGAICEKAMSREPGERYASMEAFANDLRAYLEGRVVQAYERGAIAEFRKWVGRNKALAWSVASAVLLVTVVSTGASFVLADKNEELRGANESIRQSEAAARTAEAEARRRANEVLRLSDVTRVAALREEAEALWPPLPDLREALETWIRTASETTARLELHAETLAQLATRALDAEGRTYASAEDQWQHDTLSALVADLEELARPETGLAADVQRRAAFAATIEERSVTGPEARRAWDATRAELAAEGVDLLPQLGLLPLGRDAQSGLFEFAHLQSGEPAERDANGALLVTDATGIVLVLVPGGTFRMGAQADDPAQPDYSETATEKEVPPHDVTVAPYFLGKHEVTQGQWLRVTGSNPSLYGPDTEFGGVEHTLLHPVEQVSWDDADRIARRLDLALPTEAQWEFACRAGSTTAWAWGAERESLAGHANLADASVARAGAEWPTLADWPEYDDGYPLHAPVGSFEPNAFGFHDLAGNVWEWCRDGFGFYDSPVEGPDGERVATHPQFKVNRGGSYYHTAHHARSSHRNNSAPETRQNHLGVRFARRVDG